MKVKAFSVCCLIALSIVLAACAGSAAPTDQAAVRQEQISTGETVYTGSCARCHGDNMQGGPVSHFGPPGLNTRSLATFTNAKEMYAMICDRMPANDPGTLSDNQYLDVEAFILDRNGLLPSSEPLTLGNMVNISLR